MAKEKAAAGSKREWGCADYCLVVCGVLGALPLIVSLIPPVYWRFMPPNMNMGTRFGVARKMSPLAVGGPQGTNVMWGRLSKALCQEQARMQAPDIAGAIIGFATIAVPKAAPLAGCSAWSECKAAVFQRCATYKTLHGMGIACMVLIFLGACCGLCAGLSMSSEESKSIPALKKMKSSAREKYFEKEKQQRSKTFMHGAMGFVFSFLGVVLWIAVSTSSLNALRDKSYYPFMYLNGPGAICGIVGVVCLFFAMIGGLLRNKPTEMPEKEDDDDNNRSSDYAAAAGPAPAPALDAFAPPPPPPPPPF